MKKRYLIGGLSGVAAAAVITKLLLRPRDVDWEKNRETVFHSGYSRFAEVEGVRLHYQEVEIVTRRQSFSFTASVRQPLFGAKCFCRSRMRDSALLRPTCRGTAIQLSLETLTTPSDLRLA